MEEEILRTGCLIPRIHEAQVVKRQQTEYLLPPRLRIMKSDRTLLFHAIVNFDKQCIFGCPWNTDYRRDPVTDGEVQSKSDVSGIILRVINYVPESPEAWTRTSLD